MKVTQAELLDLLKSINVDAEIVDEGSEFDRDTILAAIDGNRRKVLEPLITESLTESVKKEISGRYGGTLRSQLARISGMKRVDLDKFETDEEAIKAAWNHSSGLLEGEKAEFKKQLDEILEKHNTELEGVKTDYEGKLTTANQKYIDRDIKEFLAGQLKDAPIPQNADRGIITEDFKNYVQGKYHISYDEVQRTGELFMKDNPSMPAMNAAKNARISILDEAKEFFSPRGLWETDMSKRNPEDEMKKHKTGDNVPPTPKTIPLNSDINQKRAAMNEKLKSLVTDTQV